VWQDNREVVIKGLRDRRIDTSNYDLARQPLDDLLGRWHSVASVIISDNAVVDAFANLHIQMATHLFSLTSPAYSRGGIAGGKVNIVQFVEDLERSAWRRAKHRGRCANGSSLSTMQLAGRGHGVSRLAHGVRSRAANAEH
jgi:hypothetical protein